jgi:uncharacterized protein (TIGR01777 family)
MTIVVTGASGLIGRAVAKSYTAEGHEVRLVGRSEDKLRALYGPATPIITWEPAEEDFPRHALDGATAVFHLMGEPLGGRWTRTKKQRIVTSRVTSAHKLARALDGRPIRLVSASSFGIYPGRRGEVYDEKTPLGGAGQTFIQATIRAWENAALSGTYGDSKATVVRLGLVCSPEGYPKKLVHLFKRGLGFVAGDGQQIVPIVDIDDVVRAMRWAAEGHAGEGVVNCVTGRLPRFADVAQAIAAVVGKPIRFNVPDWLARPILGGSADYFLLSYDIRSTRALTQGFTFTQPEPEEILRRALAPYAEEASMALSASGAPQGVGQGGGENR